jgi:tetratricopeptide (TPR) repeat protein
MGNMATDAADTASGEAKAEFANAATAAFRQIVSEFPSTPQANQARSGLSRARLIAGDTAGFRAAYQDQLTNPTKYSYQELLAAAVAASRANQTPDAAALFEGALQQNPFNRDGLFNTALMYNNLGQHQKALPILARLLAIDPSNVETLQLHAIVYNAIAKGTKEPAAKRAATESAVKYYQEGEALPANVVFTEWTNGDEKSTLAGTIQNRGKTAKSFTMNVDFLDKAGAVVTSRTVTVADVAPNATGSFSVTIEAPNVLAYRYSAPK